MLLFDEIEKAHPDFFNMLLQILEDGVLTDAQGRAVNFKNTIIIMTSNIGAQMLRDQNRLGFSSGEQDFDKQQEIIRKAMLAELKKSFKPEFINRVDEIIVFHKLGQKEIKKITSNMLDALKTRLAGLQIEINFDESAAERISIDGFDPAYGARPLRRAIQSNIEDKLADELLHAKKFPVISRSLRYGRDLCYNMGSANGKALCSRRLAQSSGPRMLHYSRCEAGLSQPFGAWRAIIM